MAAACHPLVVRNTKCFFSPESLAVNGAKTLTHFFIGAHATVPITLLSCLSEPVEQFKISHQAQLLWWQDLLEWNRRDAEQEPKQFLVKRNVNQTHVAWRQGRNETRLIHTAASLPYS